MATTTEKPAILPGQVQPVVGRPCWICGASNARPRHYNDGRTTREHICAQCWVDMAASGYPIDHPNQSTRCAWCQKPLGGKVASITVQNTDDEGITHRLAWCTGTGCTEDPVYRAVCESRRMPGNALMVLAERRREALRAEQAND